MQARLLTFFLPIFLLIAAALGSLLAVESAKRISLSAELERSADAQSVMAALTETELQLPVQPPGDTRDLHLRIDGAPTAPNRLPQDRIVERIDNAIEPGATVWPWTDGDFVTIERATVDTPTIENASIELTILEPADEIRGAVSKRWVILAASVMTAIALIAVGTYPLTRWALRPIEHLDQTARALADGDMTARATSESGPPETRRLANSINAMAERVDAGLHRERAFVASASHHFGNLLTPLRLRLETIGSATPSGANGAGPTTDPTVEEALAELDRLESAAERLLQLNRAEEDGLQPIALEVGTIVDESLRSWRVVAESRGIQLHRTGSETARALASPGAIEETLDNLIDNAMKYADGSEITLRVMRGLHNVRIVVSDKGPGLTDHEIEQAQGRFWRGPTQQNKPGSGLGLAIVDALAAQSGAHFELRNGADGGLEAALVLKRAPDVQ